jgi:hypothetical protein
MNYKEIQIEPTVKGYEVKVWATHQDDGDDPLFTLEGVDIIKFQGQEAEVAGTFTIDPGRNAEIEHGETRTMSAGGGTAFDLKWTDPQGMPTIATTDAGP